MRTDVAVNITEKNIDLILDRCFIIQAYKNPEITLFYIHKKIYDSKIFINEIMLNKVGHSEFDKIEIILKMKKLFGEIIVKYVTNNEWLFSLQLDKTYSILHFGYLTILAFITQISIILDKIWQNLVNFLIQIIFSLKLHKNMRMIIPIHFDICRKYIPNIIRTQNEHQWSINL